MGNSKIVMISGIYLIMGMYSLSISPAETERSGTAVTVAHTADAAVLAKTGISLALKKMGSDADLNSFTDEVQNISGGRLIFSAIHPPNFPASRCRIVSEGIVNGDTVKVSAIFSYERGRWRITGHSYQPST